jgi:hypothetical protein
MRAALSDTTVLSNFAHIERPDLLRALFSTLLVPPSVLEELMKGEGRALIPKCSWDWLEVVVPTASEKVLARIAAQSENRRERAVFARRNSHGGSIVGWRVLRPARSNRAANWKRGAVSLARGAATNSQYAALQEKFAV